MRGILGKIRNKPEEHRRRAAFLTSLFITLIIFAGWLNSKGIMNSTTIAGKDKVREVTQTAQVFNAERAASPIESSKKIFSNTLLEINNSVKKFTESVGDVLVPFMTGIEIYERN